MTINAAFAIGIFLAVASLIWLAAATLIWKKLRFLEARLKKMQNELTELHTVESRLFLMALNSKAKAEATVPHNIPTAETNAGKVLGKGSEHPSQSPAPDAGPPFAEDQAPGSELIPLAPLAQRSAAEQEVGTPANRFDGRNPLPGNG